MSLYEMIEYLKSLGNETKEMDKLIAHLELIDSIEPVGLIQLPNSIEEIQDYIQTLSTHYWSDEQFALLKGDTTHQIIYSRNNFDKVAEILPKNKQTGKLPRWCSVWNDNSASSIVREVLSFNPNSDYPYKIKHSAFKHARPISKKLSEWLEESGNEDI